MILFGRQSNGPKGQWAVAIGSCNSWGLSYAPHHIHDLSKHKLILANEILSLIITNKYLMWRVLPTLHFKIASHIFPKHHMENVRQMTIQGRKMKKCLTIDFPTLHKIWSNYNFDT